MVGWNQGHGDFTVMDRLAVPAHLEQRLLPLLPFPGAS